MFLSRRQKCKWLILSACLATSNTWAQVSPTNVQGVFSLLGGYVRSNPSNGSYHFVGTDDDQFVYSNHGSNQNAGLIGIFAGAQWQIPNSTSINRFGLEYDYVSSTRMNGTSWVGVQADTSTPYTYQYHEQNQQILAVAQLLMMTDQCYHPYIMVGLGTAFNRLYGFNTSTTQQGSINLSPTFKSQTQTSFTYSLGLGVEMNMNPRWSMGIGYRFSDFGRNRFNHGQVNFNNYHAEVPFSLENNHTYANQFIVDLNYLA